MGSTGLEVKRYELRGLVPSPNTATSKQFLTSVFEVVLFHLHCLPTCHSCDLMWTIGVLVHPVWVDRRWVAERERERDRVNIYTYNNRKHQQCKYTPHKTHHMYTNNSASLSVNSVTFTGSFCSTKVSPPLVCTEIQYTDTQLTSDLETGVVC